MGYGLLIPALRARPVPAQSVICHPVICHLVIRSADFACRLVG